MKKLISILAVAAIAVVFTTCLKHDEMPHPDLGSGTALRADSLNVAEAAAAEDTIAEEAAAADTLPAAPEKYIYLTIDDSPLSGSRRIDSIVTATQVKTNIFAVGKPIDESGRFKRNFEILRDNPCIEIYNHSYSHANNRYAEYYKDPEGVFEDFEKNRTEFGITHKIARLPGRNLWQMGGRTKNYGQSGATSAALLAEGGYDVFGWDVEWEYDHTDYTPRQTVDELVGQIDSLYRNPSLLFAKGHVVLLMHDQMFTKVNDRNDLGGLIGKLLDRGYAFEWLTSYPQ